MQAFKIETETTRSIESSNGKTFVLTGSLENFTRAEAKEKIERFGGKVAGSVTRKTDYLLTGKSPGSKLKRATELGVAVIDESQFMKMFSE